MFFMNVFADVASRRHSQKILLLSFRQQQQQQQQQRRTKIMYTENISLWSFHFAHAHYLHVYEVCIYGGIIVCAYALFIFCCPILFLFFSPIHCRHRFTSALVWEFNTNFKLKRCALRQTAKRNFVCVSYIAYHPFIMSYGSLFVCARIYFHAGFLSDEYVWWITMHFTVRQRCLTRTS